MLLGLVLTCTLVTSAPVARNLTVVLSSNNVASLGREGHPPDPTFVKVLGVVATLEACEELCYKKAAPLCQSYTWHHTDFEKASYRGHCYAHTDSEWAPHTQSKIDSGCRNDLPEGSEHPPCDKPAVGPPPPPAPTKCNSDFDCSGHNGVCSPDRGTCACKPGWSGTICSQMVFVPKTGRVAYVDPLWTWGGSPIKDTLTPPTYHVFSSRMSANCGILHYCMNSEVVHLTSTNASGPYTHADTALAPRMMNWDNGAVHGISVHRLPNGTYALFYMGAEQPGLKAHPNCTPGSGDTAANKTTGSHNGRRIGIATSAV
jgi:hypothetical protein